MGAHAGRHAARSFRAAPIRRGRDGLDGQCGQGRLEAFSSAHAGADLTVDAVQVVNHPSPPADGIARGERSAPTGDDALRRRVASRLPKALTLSDGFGRVRTGCSRTACP
jgi:hypothetical protein